LRVGTGVLVIDLANGTTVESIGIAAKLRGLDAQIANGTPGLREISYASTGNEALVSNGGRSTILLVYPPAAGSDVPAEVLDQLSAAARTAVPGATVHSTGVNALASGAPPARLHSHRAVSTGRLAATSGMKVQRRRRRRGDHGG
jgi:RND superfamily putative drug exporter